MRYGFASGAREGVLAGRHRRRGGIVTGGLVASGVNESFLVVIGAAAVLYGTPLLFAALGELLAERSGVLNLGVEGMMLVGAVMGFWAVQRVEIASAVSLALALGVAAVAGAAMALIHAYLVITLRSNQIVSGLALTIFAGAAGLSAYLGNDLDLSGAPAEHAFPALDVLGLGDLPIVGPIVFDQSVLVYLSWACVLAIGVYLARTRPGLNVRAVGGVAGRRGRHGHRRHGVPLRAHGRRRSTRRNRRGLLQPSAHAPVGSRAHRRRRLDRGRARHLRVLEGGSLPPRRLPLRRVLGATADAPSSRLAHRGSLGGVPVASRTS